MKSKEQDYWWWQALFICTSFDQQIKNLLVVQCMFPTKLLKFNLQVWVTNVERTLWVQVGFDPHVHNNTLVVKWTKKKKIERKPTKRIPRQMFQETKQEVNNISTQIFWIVVQQKSSLEMFSDCWLVILCCFIH